MDKQNIRIELMYDGTAYHGFQRQKNGLTVQECLENAIEAITGEKATLTGCGRTDAGVHAECYTANFFSGTRIPPERLPFALNSKLDGDIRVTHAEYAAPEFHARFSALEKTYSYKILNAPIADAFLRDRVWFYPAPLDFEKMREGAAHITGKHSFAAFMAAGSPVKSTVRTVSELTLRRDGALITMEITADGFLYNMVRIIAGTLVYCGNGKISPETIPQIISSEDRTLAGVTAPPQGLMLKRAYYRTGERHE